jgi:ribosomal protein S18 acetylase RimI-like enzyme
MSSEISLQPLQTPSLPTVRPVQIRPLQLRDRAPLHQLLSKDGLFTREEISVALELVDGALAEPGGEYRVLIAERDGRLSGYVCYGPTPMAEGTWDLYWIVTHPDARGSGVARALVARMEDEIRTLGARLVRVETSRQDGYGAARAFYQRLKYPVVAELPDFYKPGDDLLVMLKRL